MTGHLPWRARLARLALEARFLLELGAIRFYRAISWPFSVDWNSRVAGRVARVIGPLLPVSNVARAQLRAAFPEKSEQERDAILRGVWDNLGRTFSEYLFFDRIWDMGPEEKPTTTRLEIVGQEVFFQLRDDGLPCLGFTSHLANWEIPAIGAAAHGLDIGIIYRAPKNPYVARLLQRVRAGRMGHIIDASFGAPALALGAIKQGRHVGMLVDIFSLSGVPIPFFGRPARTVPTIARLVREVPCPVVGVRVERLDGVRFRITVTPPLTVPRTDDPKADERALLTEINRILEGWIRERPEQWNWLHRRWRDY